MSGRVKYVTCWHSLYRKWSLCYQIMVNRMSSNFRVCFMFTYTRSSFYWKKGISVIDFSPSNEQHLMASRCWCYLDIDSVASSVLVCSSLICVRVMYMLARGCSVWYCYINGCRVCRHVIRCVCVCVRVHACVRACVHLTVWNIDMCVCENVYVYVSKMNCCYICVNILAYLLR